MSSRVEYRVVYKRDGREQYREGFPSKNINWGGYWHDIRQWEVVRWEERTIETSSWRTSA